MRVLSLARNRNLPPESKVNASALGTRESQQHFGEKLAKYDIQPVWLSIENGTDEQLVFLPIATDPDYYSPYEVSIDSTARCLSQPTGRATDSFSSIR